MDATTWLASEGFDVAGTVVPWGVIGLILAVLIGLFLIRAAITLVKVLIVVAIGVAAYLAFQFILKAITG